MVLEDDDDDDFLEDLEEAEQDDFDNLLAMPAVKRKRTNWQRIERLRDKQLLKRQLEDFGDWAF